MPTERKYTTAVNNRLQHRMTQLLLTQNYTRYEVGKIVARELSGRFKKRFKPAGVLWQWDVLNKEAPDHSRIVWDYRTKTYKPASTKGIKRKKPAKKANLAKSVEETVMEVQQAPASIDVLEGVTPKNIVVRTSKDGISIHINMD